MSFLSRLWRASEPAGTQNDPFELPADEPKEYGLVLLNDDTHSFPYVINLLHDLFGISPDEGLATATTIHFQGWQVIFSGTWQEVVQKRAEILAYGPDPDMPTSTGPLKVEIHEAS